MQILRDTAGLIYRSRRKLATAGVGVMVCMLAFHVIFGANGFVIYSKKRSEYRNLDAELKSLQAENERLQKNIHSLKTDPKTIEKEAREQLKYARPGEVVYSLPEKPQSAHSTAKK